MGSNFGSESWHESAPVFGEGKKVPATDTFVYFAARHKDGRNEVKIGVSVDPPKRMADIFIRAKLLCYVHGDHCTEKALHKIFAASRIQNEWFHPTPRLQRLIAFCVEHGKLPDDILAAVAKFREWDLARWDFEDAAKAAMDYLAIKEIWPGMPKRNDQSKKANIDWLPSGFENCPPIEHGYESGDWRCRRYSNVATRKLAPLEHPHEAG